MPTSQFTPPQGDYKLLVLRPDVTVGSLTTGGMVEPRADWTDQARASIVDALRAQQAARGGKVTIVEHRNELAGVDRAGARGRRAAQLRRRPVDRRSTNISAIICRPSAARASTGRSAPDAVRLGQKTGYDYALFLHAEDQVASGGRIALGVLGLAGCFVGFCAPNVGGQQQLDYASLVDLKTGEVVWFNVVLGRKPGAGHQVRRPPHARRAQRRWSTGCSAG